MTTQQEHTVLYPGLMVQTAVFLKDFFFQFSVDRCLYTVQCRDMLYCFSSALTGFKREKLLIFLFNGVSD